MVMRLIRSLMPKEERFVELFAAHAECMVAASVALTAMMQAPDAAQREERFRQLSAIESEADQIARQVMTALHRAFITPFDRSDIHGLITALDDTIDLIEEVAQHAALYQVETFTPMMLELAGQTEACARLTAEAMPLLADISRNAQRITSLCEQVGRVESDADRVLRRAVSSLIAERPEPITFLGLKEVYELLEAVTDRCDDVADTIEGIVLDHV